MASPPLYSYVHTYSIKSETVEFFNMFSATCALANYQLSVRNGTVYTQFLDPDIGFYEQSLTK